MRFAPLPLAVVFVAAAGIRPSDACLCVPTLYWVRPVIAP
jgi:hypothetical protein